MDFHFENIVAIWHLIWLLPVAILWYIWYKQKSQLLQRLATSPRLLATFIRNQRPLREQSTLILFLIAIIFLTLSLMNPVIRENELGEKAEGISLMMAIDVSNSMLARDVSPNRLEKARNLSLKLLERLNNVKIGLIAFAGDAILKMPPTSDVSALRQAIQTLSVESVSVQGTNLEEVLKLSYESLGADILSQKALWIITDGEELDGAARKYAAELAEKGLLIHVAGVGTEEGIILLDNNSSTPFLNNAGEPVYSKMDAGLLSDLAVISGGSFYPLLDINESVQYWTDEFRKLDKINLPNRDLINYKSLSPIFLSLSLFSLLLSGLLDFFAGFRKRKPALLLSLFLLPVFSLNAQDKGAWVKEANQLYSQGDFAGALEKFKVVNIDDPKDERTILFLGLTHFHLGNYQESADFFTGLYEKTKDDALKDLVAYNAGLALAKADKLSEAIAYFKEVQAKYPDDADVRRNLQKALMEQKRQEPPKENEEQDEPPMREEDASRKLQSVMEEERKVRERMKPRATGTGKERNW